ncbi:MAG: hypothetical protein HQ547_01960 [Candidatus Omnitrophica bacterium]|nr:hypothetical protein [Candidatus Omnitrophota bacterium]
MKKRLCIILVLVGLMSMGFSISAYAKAKSKAKPVILTTMDVKEAYEVIGIVSYRTSGTGFDDLMKGLKKAAMGIKADAVIGLRCVSYVDYMYAYGTAVKFKKEKK